MIECCDGETKGKAGILISSTESESCSSSPFHQLSSRKQQKLRITTVWLPAMRSSSRFRCSYSDPPLFAAFCLFFVSFVIKKRRSRTGAPMAGIYPSGHSSNMEKAETTSCLSSSSSSGISSARSQRKTNKAEKIQRKRRSSGSNHMRRRAEAILKLLSGGCFSEVNIRRVLGDSPDTSKALRMYTLSFCSLLCNVSPYYIIQVSVSVAEAGRSEEIRNGRAKRPLYLHGMYYL
ncbi:Detected protein of unknown function [Hibiscus syriacus]|uniref:HTH three-helical bundle domain-containing protein n=1 Tax=Hibiscus syriacus TaxID=106335 RepID=A0A6A2X9H1_HIBSY|nr:Detected protein of unknown function [Hibiscus syriacus]